MRKRAASVSGVLAGLTLGTSTAFANGAGGEHAGAPLHFAHPVVTESPSPDTKLRVDYRRRDADSAGGDTTFDTLRVEGEYAFSPSLSVLAEVPYVRRDPPMGDDRFNFDSSEVAVKYANFALAERGFLLGGGFALGLPTGSDDKGIGSDQEVEIEPFANLGYKRGSWETVARLEVGVPTNQPAAEKDAVDAELGFQFSALYHLTDRFKPLLEVDGETIVAGNDDETVANLSPGIKFHPTADPDLALAASAGFSLTDDEAFNKRFIFSAFFHF